MTEKTIGFAMCGSFCTFEPVFTALEELATHCSDIIPIFSEISQTENTRFGTAEQHLTRIKEICGREPLMTINEVEPIGPKGLLDLLIVAPCTGNTVSKMAQGITDSAVTMAIKAQLRNERPVLLALSSNDGLGASGKNIAEVMVRKHVYMVPFGQDDPVRKPTSLKADMSKLYEAAELAMQERQLQPILLRA